MIAGYKSGITPNPDVLCKRAIKFGAFRAWAHREGAEKIATGHYARIVRHHKNEVSPEVSPTYLTALYKGVDATKDQSYFLYQLTQDDLEHALFPIGGLQKREVRALARRYGLPSAERPDSQGLCFVGDIEVGEFLARFIPMHEGDVRDVEGKVIGRHFGYARYTIGQRHGFDIFNKNASDKPHYVTSIDAGQNIVIVSDEPTHARVVSVTLSRVNWIAEPPSPVARYGVSLRYHQPPQWARIQETAGLARILFEEPQVITPGQSAVVYDGERCLGGGIVNKEN